jgi:hypothetical protein
MEWTLEQDDVRELLVEAMKARGYPVPDDARLTYRQNHKKGTVRFVVTTAQPRGPRSKQAASHKAG